MADILEVGSPLPASIGRCADLYRDVRDLRLLMEKEAEKVAAREKEIKEHIISNLSSGLDTGAAGLRYRAQIVKKEVPKISEEQGGWGALYSWIRKNDRFDMLQKRLSDKAVMEFRDTDKRMPPGTEVMLVPDVSITKI